MKSLFVALALAIYWLGKAAPQPWMVTASEVVAVATILVGWGVAARRQTRVRQETDA